MGFAKYQEDIVSRYVGDFAMRTTQPPASPPKAATPNTKNQSDQRTKKMSSLKKFAVATPRPLPVIVLADASGSMGENGKIAAVLISNPRKAAVGVGWRTRIGRLGR